MAEIVRAGILSVDEGQTEAAQALGMRRLQDHAPDRAAAGDAGDHPADRQRDHLDAEDHLAGRRVAVTWSCSARRSSSTARNYKTIPLLIVASVWYLVITSILSVGQYYLERTSAGAPHGPAAGPQQRLRQTTRSRPEATALAGLDEPSADRGRAATRWCEAEGVHKYFGRLEVLKGIDLDGEPGEVMCLIGPSGSGKSTFLRCINHLEKIDARPSVGRRAARRLPAEAATSSTSCKDRRSPPSAGRSAWCSSGSTCSRT